MKQMLRGPEYEFAESLQNVNILQLFDVELPIADFNCDQIAGISREILEFEETNIPEST